MKKMITAALALCFLCACSQEPAVGELFAMDTIMDFSIYGSQGEAALVQTEELIRELEATLSRTDESSEISKLNAAGSARVSPQTAALLASAQEYGAATAGAFDVTIAPVANAWGFTGEKQRVPGQEELEDLLALVDSSAITVEGDMVTLSPGQMVDLGGIAKGYTSDCVEAVLRQMQVESAMVVLGGNVYAHGEKPGNTPWRVGVRDPQNQEAYVGVLELQDAYAITSGGYQRYFEQDGIVYHHILDPDTGCPAESGLLSVTVVAPANGEGEQGAFTQPGNGAMCDAFSTALFVMGEERALDFWRESGYTFDLVLVTEDGRVVVTEGLAQQFSPEEGTGYVYETVS